MSAGPRQHETQPSNGCVHPACSEASDTPETDHALHGVWYRGDHGSAIPALCRKLERERNELVARINEWRELSDDGLRLRCGEMTAQEIRTVRAVLNALPPNVSDQIREE